MELHPRYDDAPAVDIAVCPDAIRAPFLRQRRRLATNVASLTDEQLAATSRCEAWTVADVLIHLIDVDRFWGASAAMGVAGEPTRFLENFDPEATPKRMVEGWAGVTPDEVRRQYIEASTALCDAIEALPDDAWSATAEAPPGHVSVVSMVHHALWDCWIHERDIAVPLGLDVADEDDELAASLAYAAGLSPAFGVFGDATRTGRLGIVATDPDLSFVVDIGHTTTVSPGPAPEDAHMVSGRATELIEGLSQRAPLDHELPAEHAWMVDGLAEVFQPATS